MPQNILIYKLSIFVLRARAIRTRKPKLCQEVLLTQNGCTYEPLLVTPDSSNEYTVLRRMANTLLNGALLVRLSQVASVLALGMETHMEPSFDPLGSLQPELCACREAIIVVPEEHRGEV